MKRDLKIKKLRLIYSRLFKAFGPQYWWPGDTAFEVIIGAILTQNAAWSNVEKAIVNLKKENVLSLQKMGKMKVKALGRLIKPSGFYNIKARRLKNMLFFLNKKGNSIRALRRKDARSLRNRLLEINGIGRETADSILLYALDKPVFVIDAYTKRILSRHRIIKADIEYDALQRIFMNNFSKNQKYYSEYHALFVAVGKNFCRARKPLCAGCPLEGI